MGKRTTEHQNDRSIRESEMSDPTNETAARPGASASQIAAVLIFAFLLGRQSVTFTGTIWGWIGLAGFTAALASVLWEIGKTMRRG
jgi:hypothetical protein